MILAQKQLKQNTAPIFEEDVENLQIRVESQINKLYESIDLEHLIMNDVQDDVSVTVENQEIFVRVICKYCNIEKPLSCLKKNGKISYIDVINLKNHLIRDHQGIVRHKQARNINSSRQSRQSRRPDSQNDDDSMSSNREPASQTEGNSSRQTRRPDSQNDDNSMPSNIQYASQNEGNNSR